MIKYCDWWYYTHRNYIDTIDGEEIGTIRIISFSEHHYPDALCYTPTDSSTNQIAQLHFEIKNEYKLKKPNIPDSIFLERVWR